MPLSPKQRTIIEQGAAACNSCQAFAAMLRRLGNPDEAAEERFRAMQSMYAEVPGVLAEFDAKMKEMKANGTK